MSNIDKAYCKALPLPSGWVWSYLDTEKKRVGFQCKTESGYLQSVCSFSDVIDGSYLRLIELKLTRVE